VAPNDKDRRRFLLATALTLAALPALWWVNRQADSGAPNVATVGIDVGEGSGSESEPDTFAPDTTPMVDPVTGQPVVPAPATTTPPVPTTPQSTDALDPSAPIFLDGPSGVAGAGTGAIATPAAPDVEHITTSASYRSTISPTDTCLASNITTGTTITVTNLNNGHSITCTATRVYSTADTGLILFTDTFAQIADLTDAPIPVEISQ
jgi:hypothetical protein